MLALCGLAVADLERVWKGDVRVTIRSLDTSQGVLVAAGLGFEPRLSGPEPDELPLLHPANDTPEFEEFSVPLLPCNFSKRIALYLHSG